jgi:hypothetical protein
VTLGHDRRGRGGPVHLGVALLRHPDLHGGRGRLHVPVSEGLREQGIDRRRGLRAGFDIPGVRPGAVIGHDLQPRSALEGDRPQLGARDRRGEAAAFAGRDRAGERRVEQQVTHLGEDGVQWLGHTTILPREILLIFRAYPFVRLT